MATGHAIINVDASGENTIVLYRGANYALTVEQLEDALRDAGSGDMLVMQNETSLQAEAAQIARGESGVPEPKSKITVAELCNRFLSAAHPRAKCEEGYRRAAASALNCILPLIGSLRIDKLLIWPGSNPQKQPRVVRWEAKSPPKVVQGEGPAGRAPLKGGPVFEVYDALQPRGYAVELRLPKKIIPGYREGAPLKLAIKVVDVDGPGAGKLSYAETSPLDRPSQLSEVEFAEGQSSYGDLLKDLNVRASDVFFERNADIGEGLGRLLMAGKFLAFSGKAYAYLEMAPSRSDIKDVQLIALEGDKQAVAVRIAEHGNGGGREVLRIYRLAGGRFESLFAAEVAKEQGARRLSVQVSFVKKGKGTDIELTPQPAVGFSEASYGELPAEDMIPILLPWQDKKTRYVWKSGKFAKQ